VAHCCRAFDRIHDRAMEDQSFRSQFRLLDWEETLLEHDPGFRDPSPVSRLDAFFTHERGGLRFTEYNAETPAAAAYNDVLAEVTYGLPIMRLFLRRYEVRPQPARHLRDARAAGRVPELVGHARAAAHRHPRLARGAHLQRVRHHPAVPGSQGLECVIADPREVEYRGGKLYAGDMQVDLIYKRVLITSWSSAAGWSTRSCGPSGTARSAWSTRSAASSCTRRPAWQC
jgi:hypothetical protein